MNRQQGAVSIGLVLFVAFIIVPIVELYVIVQVAQVITVLPTILLLITMSVVGAALVKREGLKAWQRFRNALDELRPPTEEVIDGALVLFGGALMLTPGFVSDVVGLLLVAPPSRRLINRLVRKRVRLSFGPSAGRPRRPRPAPTRDEIVDVEVVSVERNIMDAGPRGRERGWDPARER